MSSSRHITENDRSIAARAAAASISAQGKRTIESAPGSSSRGQPMVQSASTKGAKAAGERPGYLSRPRMGSFANLHPAEPDIKANTKQRYPTSAPNNKLSRRNTWNNINSSSSSIALAAASSIARSNTSVLSSQPHPSVKKSYTVYDSHSQTEKIQHSNQDESEPTNKSVLHNSTSCINISHAAPSSAASKLHDCRQDPSVSKLTTDISHIKVGQKDLDTSNTKDSSTAKQTVQSITNSPIKNNETVNNEDLLDSSLCTSANISTDSFASWDVEDNHERFDLKKHNSSLPSSSNKYSDQKNIYSLPVESSYSSNNILNTPHSNKMFHHHRSKSKSSRIKSIFGIHQHQSKQHFPSSVGKIESHPYMNSYHGLTLSNNQLATDYGPACTDESLSSSVYEGHNMSSKNTSEYTTNEPIYETSELPGKLSSSLSLSTPSPNIPHLNSQQQLNFPSTLRKEKKSGKMGLSRSRGKQNSSGGDEFNENKPWKHHHSIAMLNIIDTSEKKRYDGVFVTNKGCYILDDVRLANVMEELKKVHNATLENQVEECDEAAGTEEDINKAIDKQDNEGVSGSYLDTLAGFVNTYSIPTDRIHGLVVREIWKRSKLDSETLFKLWNLVLSNRKLKWSLSLDKELADENEYTMELDPPVESFDDGTLTREEFIVGMWIIDQCLYGRKLPRAIPKNVWDSVNSDLLFNAANLKKWKKNNRLVEQGRKAEDSTGKRKLFKKVVRK